MPTDRSHSSGPHRPRSRARARSCALGLGLVAACLASAAPASAATHVVTTTADSGSGSFRAAVDGAAAGDTIDLTGLSGAIELESPVTIDTDDLTIEGPGADELELDGGGDSQILLVRGPVLRVAISGLSLVNGRAQLRGGALRVAPDPDVPTEVTVTASRFERNRAVDGAGAVSFGGAIFAAQDTRLVVRDSAFRDNLAGGPSGVDGSGYGGAIVSHQTEISGSTFTGNRAHGFTTPHDFNSVGRGGAVVLFGSGPALPSTITNSTFTANSAGAADGSGVGFGGAIYASDRAGGLRLSGVTIAGNAVGSASANFDSASGVYADIYSWGGGGTVPVAWVPVTATATIVAGNTGAPNCNIGVTAASEHNLEGPAGATSCGFDRESADPLLEPPANNAGPTETMALGDESPALDAVPAAACEPTDQRGLPRPDFGRPSCDVGAFERQTSPATSTELACDPASVDEAVATTCTATVTETDPDATSTPTGAVTFATDRDGSFSDSSCQLAATATAGVASCAVDYTPDAASAGQHGLTADYASDDGYAASAGGTSVTAVDAEPPDTTIDSGPAGLTSSADPSFGFSSPDTGATFECRLDGPGATTGSFGACTSPRVFTALADGSHTFHVRAVDVAGNRDPSPASRSFTVDTEAPDTRIDSGPAGPTNNPDPAFGFSSPDAGASFECRLDGPATTTGTFGPCTSPRGFTGLANGTYTFHIRAVDAAGNSDATPATRSFTVDTTPPPVPQPQPQPQPGSQLQPSDQPGPGPVPTCTGLAATIVAAEGSGPVRGTPGPDVIVGSAGPDRIGGGGGGDVICGNGGGDVIYGEQGDDRISGGPGDDELHGGTGNDSLSGNSGNDLIRGGQGNDRTWGRAGNDRLSGNTGDDLIYGGRGSDRIWGRDGDDRLHARDGHRDTLDCGDGDNDRATSDPADTTHHCEHTSRATAR